MMQVSFKHIVFLGWRYAFFAVLVLAFGGYFFFRQDADTGATLTIVSGDFKERVSVSGTVIAAKDANLGFAASGRISNIYASVGQRVGARTILAEIENGDLVAALSQKRSALMEAEARLASLKVGTRPEEIAVASAAVASAEAALVDMVRDAYTTSDDAIHNKADTLFTNPRSANPQLTFNTSNANLRNVIESNRVAIEPTLTQWELLVESLSRANVVQSAERSQSYLVQVMTLLADMNSAVNQGVPDTTITAATLTSYGTMLANARLSVNAAAAELTTDSTALVSAEKNLALKQAGSTSENIAAQEASVAAAEADVENAQAALSKTRVIAPFTGIVTRMDAKVGEIISPNESLIAMQSADIFQIETFVPEVVIARVTVGNPATTTLDAYSSTVPFPAIVIAVDPAETVKDGVPTYKTTLAFLAHDSRIRSGMTANVVIETGVLSDSIVIPAGAVGTSGTTKYVTVVGDKGAVNRQVETGTTPSLGQIEILSGLSEGDVILLTPATP